MKCRFQRLLISSIIIVFLFNIISNEVKSQTRKPRPASTSRSKKSYSPQKSFSNRPSGTSRQRYKATNSVKIPTTDSSKSKTRQEQSQTKAESRKQSRQLKAESRKQIRQLKVKNRKLKRETLSNRRNARLTIDRNNSNKHYPITRYPKYSLKASKAFNNFMFGIYFHDYYDHRIRHSYLWHYHRRDYDRSHWDFERQREYEYFMEYYSSQGIEYDPYYVDPNTYYDEDYIDGYIDENQDEFYSEIIETVTVEELPDEESLLKEIRVLNEIPKTNPSTTINQKSRFKDESLKSRIWSVILFGSIGIGIAIFIVVCNRKFSKRKKNEY